MSNRGALIVAAALTAFVLVVAGGIAGRLSRPDARTGGRAAAKVALASRAPAPRPVVRPALQSWRDDDDDHERHSARGRRSVESEHEDDDD